TTLEMLLGVGTITAIAVVCSIGVELAGPRITDPAEHLGQITTFTLYAACFLVFLVGLRSWLRTGNRTPAIVRVLLVAIAFGIAVGPWIVAAIGGILGSGADDAL